MSVKEQNGECQATFSLKNVDPVISVEDIEDQTLFCKNVSINMGVTCPRVDCSKLYQHHPENLILVTPNIRCWEKEIEAVIEEWKIDCVSS